MESAVTFLCNLLIFGSFGYFGIGLVLHLADRWNQIDLAESKAKALAGKQVLSLPAASTAVEVQIPQREAVLVELEEE